MTTTKTPWTPGPWEIVPRTKAQSRFIVGDSGGGSIADCEPAGPWMSGKEADANCRIIKESPTMAELLTSIVCARINNLSPQDFYNAMDDLCDEARAILARARGDA